MKPRTPKPAPKSTLSAENLTALGAERLAALLMEVAEGKADVKRRLRLELLGEIGGDSVIAAIIKRLEALEKAKSYIDARKARDFLRDLEALRSTIADRVGATDAKTALDLMWRLLGVQDKVLSRLGGSGTAPLASFRQAVSDIGALASRSQPDTDDLARRLNAAMIADDYGTSALLIPSLAPALGTTGLDKLRAHFQSDLDSLLARGGPAAWSSRRVLSALRAIADIQGDVEAFRRAVPPDAALIFAPAVARRLIAAGKAAEALDHLEEAKSATRRGHMSYSTDLVAIEGEPSFEETEIDALEASGTPEKAQARRWQVFETKLAVAPLKSFLKRLPDFDDMEAEEKALDLVGRHRETMPAVAFLTAWPAPARLSRLIEARHDALGGDDYERLNAAAAALAEHFPRAACLALRAMVLDTLRGSKSARYRYGARALRRCLELESEVSDWGGFETPPAFLARLRRDYGRRYGFWNEFDQAK